MRKLLLLLCLIATPALAANLDLTWTYPSKNVDGTDIPATGAGSIASSKVEWGTCTGTAFGTKAGEATVPAPTKTYSVPNLAPGTHCARVAVTNSYGVASDFTAAVSRTVDAPKPLPPVITMATVVRLYLRDNLSLVAGTIALGVECGDQAKGEWHAVNRSAVKLNFIGRIARDIPLVAKCGANG
jgi:predicted phage tail protein